MGGRRRAEGWREEERVIKVRSERRKKEERRKKREIRKMEEGREQEEGKGRKGQQVR